MNRPFMAFGALMTFLTLAMFAVSSSSRSTSVQPPTRNNQRAASARNLSIPREALVAAKLNTHGALEEEGPLVAPAPEEPVEKPSQSELGNEDQYTKPQLAAVKIEIAVNLANLEPGQIDCRARQEVSAPSGLARTCELLSADDELRVFRSVFGRRLGSQSGPTAASDAPPAPSVAWSEYAEFMADWPRIYALNADAAAISDASGSVRSGDWLLHSAASSLSRLGQMLEAAAVMIQADTSLPGQ